ncbi:MAG: DNA repair protein RecO [Ruminococcus sp.]|nr:DNA repair protein RecO [Ruminococcus sp.]
MLITMNGLVLREKQAGEKGRFLDILTQEQGVVEVFVRGAKKATSKSTCVTQLFSYATFCLEQRGDMYYFQSAKPIRIFYGLRENLDHLSLASYFSDWIRYAVPKGRQENMVLRLMLNTLHYLTEEKRDERMLKALFELRFASELGLMPDVLMCKRCMNYLPDSLVFSVTNGHFWCEDCYPGTEDDVAYSMRRSGLEMIRHIVLMDFARLFHFRAGEETLNVVSKFAEEFLCCHLSVRPRSLDFYHNIKRNHVE